MSNNNSLGTKLKKLVGKAIAKTKKSKSAPNFLLKVIFLKPGT